jgi:hypothetical protein
MAVTKRKLSYYNEKGIDELKDLPNAYFPGILAGVDNFKVPAESFFDTFPTKVEMNEAISHIPGGNGIVWIYNNGRAYTDTINALNSKKLPVYVYSTMPSKSGTSAVPAGVAYIKKVQNDGVSFYSLIDTNAEFTEYFVKNNNTVETTDCKNVDSCTVIEHDDPQVFTKIQNAVDYGQAVICKSGTNYMTLSRKQQGKFGFRYDSDDTHGYWNIAGNNYATDWSYVEDPSSTIDETIEGIIDTTQGQQTFNFENPLNFDFGTITIRLVTQSNGHPTVEILNNTTTVKTFEATVTCFTQEPATDFCNVIIPVTGPVTGILIRYARYIVNNSPVVIHAEGVGKGNVLINDQITYDTQPVTYDNQPIIFDT